VSEQSFVKETLEKALQDGLNALKETLDLPALETLRNAYLSKKGIFTAHMQALAKASAEERPQLGKIINDAKTRFQQALQEKMDAFKEREMAEKLASERVDVSLAGRQAFKGGLHPVTLTRRRIEDWFARLGFVVKDGPEIEDDFHNFTALNIPEHHPARAMQDTFYFDPQTVLRTHTSGVQIRTMEQEGVPLRIIAPGRVYRSDSDVTHTPMFHQVEGLVVEVNIVNQKARYDIYEYPHIHVVCESCGSVEDVSYDDAELGKYQEALEKKIGNIIERLNIVASVKSCKHCK